MAGSRGTASSLRQALQRYVEARQAAIIEARLALRVNDLDARALLFIADNPETRPGNLRSYLGITSAGVTTLVDRLVDRGAVRRQVDPHDRRVNRLTLTVDLSVEPWSALTKFDDAFEAAVGNSDPDESDRFAIALDSLTASALQARA